MPFRGMGGYRRAPMGDFRGFPGAYRLAGDFTDLGSPDISLADSPDATNLDGFSPTVDTGASPDFSDVTGGSSTVPVDTSSGGFPSIPSLPPISALTSGLFGGTGGGGSQGMPGSGAALAGSSGVTALAGPGVARAGGLTKRQAATARAYLAGHAHVVHRKLDSWLVRDSRRMNPGNMHALRRSMHRMKSFEHFARGCIKFTHPRPGARVKWAFHRRRKRK